MLIKIYKDVDINIDKNVFDNDKTIKKKIALKLLILKLRTQLLKTIIF